ncbi:hypothetical protein LTR66_003147 [Elasticomyces elasticus]|nr:hypothetical protein LTR66_003147 [Elasticomyces elasticus]
MSIANNAHEEGLWLFGYGEDHRGTPEAPGRVVTLIERALWESLTDKHPIAPPRTWGAAYHIPAPKVAEVREYLDIREINGYSMQYTPFHVSPSYEEKHSTAGPINCLVYIGLPDNPQFLGPQDPQALAEHIVRSRGPSGENRDYLFELDQALAELSKESGDEHVHDLARRCREIESTLSPNRTKAEQAGNGSALKDTAANNRREETEDAEEKVEEV